MRRVNERQGSRSWEGDKVEIRSFFPLLVFLGDFFCLIYYNDSSPIYPGSLGLAGNFCTQDESEQGEKVERKVG